jgi:hypothetical protein
MLVSEGVLIDLMLIHRQSLPVESEVNMVAAGSLSVSKCYLYEKDRLLEVVVVEVEVVAIHKHLATKYISFEVAIDLQVEEVGVEAQRS